MTAYNFRLYKEWMGVNQLWMTSTYDIGKMIWKIYILNLEVRIFIIF